MPDKTQYLIFEIGTRCNLGSIHKRCPNTHPERYSRAPRNGPLSIDEIAEIAAEMYHERGFRGHVGFHYYNEPLMDSARMFAAMGAISARVPEATYTLWTNGTLLPEDCSQFRQFAEIHITDYQLPDHPIRNLRKLTDAVDIRPIVHRGRLDDRIHAMGDTKSLEPCNRMFTEFIIDHHGNVHMCCYDWKRGCDLGNVLHHELDGILATWRDVRNYTSGKGVPGSCCPRLSCKMRSTHIPNFIPSIREEALKQCQV